MRLRRHRPEHRLEDPIERAGARHPLPPFGVGVALLGVLLVALGAGLGMAWLRGTATPAAAAAVVTVPSTPGAGQPTPTDVVPPSSVRERRTAAPVQPLYPGRSPVLLLGDSLAVGIAQPLVSDWPQRQVLVEALEGRSTTTAASLLAGHAATTPPVWVVSLGTNDAPETFATAAGSIMAMAGPDRCVVWFDVHRAATDESINSALGQLALGHPNLHLLDWYGLAAAHPEWFTVDDIHPSTSGYEQRAQLAAGAVAQLCTSGRQRATGTAPPASPVP